MEPRTGRIRKFFTDRRISLAIRAWAAGAVFFFIGWGTFLGRQQSIIDLVVTLGLVLGLFNILIINPGLRLMFNVAPRRPRLENTFWQRISDHLVELIKNVFIVMVVAFIYILINRVLVALFSLPADSVPLPGEPILFGVFYLLVFVALEALSHMLSKNLPKK